MSFSLVLLIFAFFFPLGMLLLNWIFPIRLFFAAAAQGLPVSVTTLLGMRFRGVDPHQIISPALRLIKSGVKTLPTGNNSLLTTLEAHHLSGGNVALVVEALIEAKNRQVEMTLAQAMAIDLSRTSSSRTS
jgi:uncharacterized protein YqfA (UPF0365 family)